MKLLIAGGGTGGHLFPALAIARSVMENHPGSKIMFVGTRYGIEARKIPDTEFPIKFIAARGLRQTGLVNGILGFLEVPAGILQSMKILWEFKPDAVLGVGGYASGPTLAAAILMRIPTAIQEQNSVMGTTNLILAGFVNKIFTSWENTEPGGHEKKTIMAGNPVRGDLLASVPQSEPHEKFRLLIFGGSRGARSINNAFIQNKEALRRISSGIEILHQTGASVTEEVSETYRELGIPAKVVEFINDMGSAYGWADLVVCRSGASSLAEITALGKASVLIPYPFAIGDHQAKNAAVPEKAGAAVVIPDEKLKEGLLIDEIERLMNDPGRLEKMAKCSLKLGRPNAAEIISAELNKLERNRE